MKTLLESTLPSEIEKRLSDDYKFGWSAALTVDTLTDVFQAFIKFLSVKKSKDNTVVLELRDANGGFHFASYITFMAQGETGADEGSWSIGFTFQESDLESDWTKYEFSQDSEALMTFYDTTYMNSGIAWRFSSSTDIETVKEGSAAQIIPILFDALADYMRLNVNTNPELEIQNTVSFRATKENGTDGVYIIVTPNPSLKQYIKADENISIAM